jgi:peptidylprolyl isomerase
MTSRSDGHSSLSEEEEEEDFGPVLPAAPRSVAPAHEAPLAPPNNKQEPPLKRERHDGQAVAGDAPPPRAPSPPSPTASTTVTSAPAEAASLTKPAAVSEEEQEETAATSWDRYRRQGLPSAALYERSFQHTTLQDTYDALAARAGHAGAATVNDVCVYYDTLGALIATVDAVGVVRVWRKLPRGVFFITELDKVFPTPRHATFDVAAHDNDDVRSRGMDAREADTAPRYHRTYWAHAYTTLQLLVFVCVEEEVVELEASDVAHGMADGYAAPPPSRTVRVHLRQVNPVTFTVENRHAFAFQVPVQRVASLQISESHVDTIVQQGQRAAPPVSSLQGDTTLPCALAYTRRPSFLTHLYAPHIAFFVALPASATSVNRSSGSGSSGASGLGGEGVVISPCFPALQAGAAPARHRHAGGLPTAVYVATRLSVANPIVQCVQQTTGLERSGTAPCVLIDATGIIDYCTIDTIPDSASAAAMSSSGLTLKVIAGLAAVPAASKEARLWRQWICFDRRQRTGFFSLLRDAQQALRQRQDSTSAAATTATTPPPAPADAQLMPVALTLTPDGKYVMVWSVRFIRAAQEALPARPSRIPSTQRSYHVTVESCLHMLEFSTGLCVGRHTETLADDLVDITSVEDINVRPAEWADYVKLRTRTLAAYLHVEEGAAVTPSAASHCNYYVMVPEVSCAQLLCGGGRDGAAPADQRVTTEGVVDGRQTHVYDVAMHDASSAPHSTACFAIRRLPHRLGEWDALVRQRKQRPDWGDWSGNGHAAAAPATPSHATALHLQLIPYGEAVQRRACRGSSNSSGVTGTSGEGFQPLCRAPLLLLRRAVAPSQDLKNLVSASPLGAALGAESRKQLFLPNMTSDSAEGLLLTTSVEAGMTALLIYSCELPGTGLAMQRLLSKDAQALLASAKELGEEARASNELQLQRLWSKLCLELHRERDYACGALLMTTVGSPPGEEPLSTTTAAATATASSATTADIPPTTSADAQAEADRQTGTVTYARGDVTTAAPTPTTTTRAAVAVKAAKLGSPEAYVLELLKDVVPQQGGAAAASPPVALVHVRGYGSVRVHLLPGIAPLACDNFIRLSRRRYYDHLTFHRVIPHVIVQGGCPRGDGTGGESAFEGGKPFQDEGLHVFPFFSHAAERRCCWLCMANAGPNTNGSQFFFTVPGGEAMPWLNGHHTVFGYAVDGLEVVQAISLAARDEEDKPLSPIVIERVDILSA